MRSKDRRPQGNPPSRRKTGVQLFEVEDVRLCGCAVISRVIEINGRNLKKSNLGAEMERSGSCRPP